MKGTKCEKMCPAGEKNTKMSWVSSVSGSVVPHKALTHLVWMVESAGSYLEIVTNHWRTQYLPLSLCFSFFFLFRPLSVCHRAHAVWPHPSLICTLGEQSLSCSPCHPVVGSFVSFCSVRYVSEVLYRVCVLFPWKLHDWLERRRQLPYLLPRLQTRYRNS